MDMMIYEWTQPMGGVKIRWKPLTVGEQLDISAAYKREDQQHLLTSAFLQARIVQLGDKPRCSLQDIRAWDAIDYAEFIRHIDETEATRRAAIRKTTSEESPVKQLEKRIEDAQEAANRLSYALRDVLDYAYAAEKAMQEAQAMRAGPLT